MYIREEDTLAVLPGLGTPKYADVTAIDFHVGELELKPQLTREDDNLAAHVDASKVVGRVRFAEAGRASRGDGLRERHVVGKLV